jgi:hypothetical protein
MSRRRIDGMDVHVPDEDAPLVGVDIEDVLYEDQESGGVIVCHTTEEYEQHSLAYNSARRLLTLLQCEGYVEQQRLFHEYAEQHAAAERAYTNLDEKKIMGLRMNRIAADNVVNLSAQMIEDAKACPRPIMADVERPQ